MAPNHDRLPNPLPARAGALSRARAHARPRRRTSRSKPFTTGHPDMSGDEAGTASGTLWTVATIDAPAIGPATRAWAPAAKLHENEEATVKFDEAPSPGARAGRAAVSAHPAAPARSW